MSRNLLFEFTIHKETKTIQVKREFNAILPLVWDAWTKPELLDQWWAPKPFKNKTKSMDLREGGFWLYAMISPENEYFWCKNDYKKVIPQNTYTFLDAFCDENGTTNSDLPSAEWTNTFTEADNITLVHIVATYEHLDDLERIIAMGFKEGFVMGLDQLENLLSSWKNGNNEKA